MDDIVPPSRFKTASPHRFRDIRILREVLLFIPVGRRCKFLLDKGRTLHINPNPYAKSGHDSERYRGDYEKLENILPTKFFKFVLHIG